MKYYYSNVLTYLDLFGLGSSSEFLAVFNISFCFLSLSPKLSPFTRTVSKLPPNNFNVSIALFSACINYTTIKATEDNNQNEHTYMQCMEPLIVDPLNRGHN